MKTQMNGPLRWQTGGEPRSVPTIRGSHQDRPSDTSQQGVGTGFQRRNLTRAGIPAAGKCPAHGQKTPGSASQSRPAHPPQPRIQSPRTPPLPARVDRLTTDQGGHLSAFSWSPRRRARPSVLRAPPAQGNAHPLPPIGRLLGMSSANWWSLPRSQTALVGPSGRQVFVRFHKLRGPGRQAGSATMIGHHNARFASSGPLSLLYSSSALPFCSLSS